MQTGLREKEDCEKKSVPFSNQLSLIWRFGASTMLPEFSSIDLGHHADSIGRMILKGEPGGTLDYPCLVSIASGIGEEVGDTMILPPEKIRFEGHIAYRCFFSGLFWLFVVSAHSNQMLTLEPLVASPAGIFPLVVSNRAAPEFLMKLAREFKKSGNLTNI